MLTYVFDKDDKDAALLGEGAFGKTYKMRNKIDDQFYAVKMIKVAKKARQIQRPAASFRTCVRNSALLPLYALLLTLFLCRNSVLLPL
jgi:hypothetical protein